MKRPDSLAEGVRRGLADLSPAHRREAIEAVQRVLDGQLMADARPQGPLRCPRCGGAALVKNGHAANGAQRHRCKGCGRTFVASAGTVLGGTKLPGEAWSRFAACFVDRLPLRACAGRCGVSLKTAFFMRHRLLEALRGALPAFRVAAGGSAELDETHLRESFKGNHSRGGFAIPRPARHRGTDCHVRGTSKEQICVMLGVNDLGDVFYGIACRGQVTTSRALELLEGKVCEGAVVSTDGARCYRGALSALGVAAHNAFGAKDRSQGVINRVNGLCSRLDGFLRPFKGVSTRRLGNYLAWFKWVETFGRATDDLRGLAMRQLAQNGYETTWRGMRESPFLFMEYWGPGAGSA